MTSHQKNLFLRRCELIDKFGKEKNLSSEAWQKIRGDESYAKAKKIRKAGNCTKDEMDYIESWYGKKFVPAYKKSEFKKTYPSFGEEGCLEFMCRKVVDDLSVKYPRIEDVKSVKVETEVKEEGSSDSLYLNEVSIKPLLDYLKRLDKPDFKSLLSNDQLSLVDGQIVIVSDKYFRDGKCLLSKSETEDAFVLEKELTTKYVEKKFIEKYFDPQEQLIKTARIIRQKMKETTDSVKLTEFTDELNRVYDELARLNKEVEKYVG